MRFGIGVLAAITILGAAIQADAQGFSDHRYRTADEATVSSQGNSGIPIGPFIFSPGLQLSWESHSNLFQSATNEISDNIYLARLRLLFEVPIRESFIRISYTPQYRDARDGHLINHWDHFVEVSGNFEFGSGFLLDAGYRFVDGDVSTYEIDPGGELIYSGRRFSKHEFRLKGDYWFSSRDGLRVDMNYALVDWRGRIEVPEATDGWYDYDQWRGRVGWLHQISPTLIMDLSYGYTDYSPDDIANKFREFTASHVTLGFQGSLNDVLTTEIRFGYLETDYTNEALEYPGFDDFSGFVTEGNITWGMGHGSRLRLDLVRRPYPSNYDLNAYYTTTAGRLLYDLQIDRFFAQASILDQSNDYDITDRYFGVKRSDDIFTWDFGIGFRLTDYLSLRGRYIHEDRDSNIDTYGFLNKVYMIDLVLGY